MPLTSKTRAVVGPQVVFFDFLREFGEDFERVRFEFEAGMVCCWVLFFCRGLKWIGDKKKV